MTALQDTSQRTLASVSEISDLSVMATGYLDARVDAVGNRMKSRKCHRAALNETVPRVAAEPPLCFQDRFSQLQALFRVQGRGGGEKNIYTHTYIHTYIYISKVI